MSPSQLLLQLCLACVPLQEAPANEGRVVEYDLTIAEQTVNLGGKATRGITVNGSIPGPVLRFHEGDIARIRVHNQLKNSTTSVHWHGLLLPYEQDGVPEVTTPLIHAGTTYTYEFPIKQAGTYWYHSHTHLQEQSGVYGSIVISPKNGENHQADRDYVLQLSDWTHEDPDEVQRSLMRGSEYYAMKKGNLQSLVDAAKKGALKQHLRNQWDRMMPMDISDVAYDAFLINGKQRSILKGEPGERIRLRLINSAASTYFYTESATGKMTLVAADGMPVEPVSVKRLLIGLAETYDVIITLPESGQWEFKATAQDGSGHASVFLGKGASHLAPNIPPPDLYHMDHMLDAALAGMSMEMDMDMSMAEDHASRSDSSSSLSERPAAPYALLRSPTRTTLPKHLPVRSIPLRLTGDMERYQWGFNGKTMAEDAIITVKKGEVLRFELINDTMMHHPLHLHGHFFRVVNQHGDHSPLKHTVDIPPMGRATIEFEANEVGDWIFHCHLLYHMMTGMTRIVSYQNDLPDTHPYNKKYIAHHGQQPHPGENAHHGGGSSIQAWNGHRYVNLGEHGHEMWGFWGEASLQSHMTEGAVNLRRRHDDFYFLWEAGWQDLEDEDFEYEIDAIYERYLNPNLRAYAGVRLTNEHDADDRAIAGIRYRLPMFVWSSLQIDTEGDLELGLSTEVQVSNRLSVFGEIKYDTNTEWEWTAGASYMLNKPLSLTAQYHSEYGLGGGLLIRF